jgi:hypothetical protein
MERYVEGKPRFLVGMENMRGGGQKYVVSRLDGHFNDGTGVHRAVLTSKGVSRRFRTRQEAERFARKLSKENGVR